MRAGNEVTRPAANEALVRSEMPCKVAEGVVDKAVAIELVILGALAKPYAATSRAKPVPRKVRGMCTVAGWTGWLGSVSVWY